MDNLLHAVRTCEGRREGRGGGAQRVHPAKCLCVLFLLIILKLFIITNTFNSMLIRALERNKNPLSTHTRDFGVNRSPLCTRSLLFPLTLRCFLQTPVPVPLRPRSPSYMAAALQFPLRSVLLNRYAN